MASQRRPPGWRRLEENGHALRPRGYAEHAVSATLAEHCVCTWTDVPVGPRHLVLPDACIDIVWDGARLIVAGPDTGPVPIRSQATFVGIRFRPGSAPGFLGTPADALRDRSVPLDDLWGSAASRLAERLAEQPHRAAALLEQALVERQAAAAEPDPLALGTLDLLRAGERVGTSLRLVVAELGVSERTLRRRCRAAFGYGPKTLERILRFRRALRLLRGGAGPAEVAQTTGYADQAHLSLECRRLAGAPPARLANQRHLVLSTNGCGPG